MLSGLQIDQLIESLPPILNRRRRTNIEGPRHWKWYGEELAQWLNGNFPPIKQEQVVLANAIRDTKRADESFLKLSESLKPRKPTKAAVRAYFNAMNEAPPNGLSRLFHKLSPQPERVINEWGANWVLRWEYSGSEIPVGMGMHEAVGWFLRLLEHGFVGRLRECESCGRWLYAKYERERFCSARCREKAFRTSPEGRLRRRNYMRRRRANLKRMEANMLKAAQRRQAEASPKKGR